MASNIGMINEIVGEHSARMQNLKRYYPFFVLAQTSFAQYREGRFAELDMGYITMASLRFFIHENSFREKDVTHEEYTEFLTNLIDRDFDIVADAAEKRELSDYIFDKLKNDGRAFEFSYYDPEEKKQKKCRVRLLESRIEEGRVLYSITPEAIEFYLDTKEIKEESRITVAQVLLEKMIRADNFKGGIEVVRRINAEVRDLMARKEQVVRLLSSDVFEGAKAYEDFMNTSAKWFSEEAKSFAKNKALVDKAVERAGKTAQGEAAGNGALREISELETELKRTIFNHSRLIEESMDLAAVSDRIIGQAKLTRLRPVFDFSHTLSKLMEQDRPDLMSHILMPLFLPKVEKSWPLFAIDNMLSLRNQETDSGGKVEKKEIDPDFKYEDERLDERIAQNFAKLFRELLDQLSKWGKLTLKEYNGILEIKFGDEIYRNRDYYAYLVHLAGKKTYDMAKLLKKQDTLLEEMVERYLPQEEKERFGDMVFDISFGEDEIELPISAEAREDGTVPDKKVFTVRDMTMERRQADGRKES